MADGGQELGARPLRRFGLLRPRADALLKRVVDVAQRAFHALEVGDVAIAGDVAAARQWPATQFHHAPRPQGALPVIDGAGLHQGDALAYQGVDVQARVRPELAAMRIEADEVGHGLAHAQQAVGVIEQALILLVPRHQPHARIHHAYALIHAVQRGQQVGHA
ncbi:hypothetical protein D3C72_935260 [compost metagenome]